MTIKTIFLDRDGVINEENNYVHKIEDFKFIRGVFETCKYLINLNYEIIIITNQSGIARGYFNKNDYDKLTRWMINKFQKKEIKILDIFYCPHAPKDLCLCRKPKPGMLLEAQKKYKIDMKNSWLIGDKEDDILAANNAGIFNTILVNSGLKIDKSKSNAKHFLESIHDSKKVIVK
jgi:D-glycero-D-manno-heptose 1,7-bisphosphate phosphatase